MSPMKTMLRFLRSFLLRLGLLPHPEPTQLDFLARLEPAKPRVGKTTISTR